MTQLALSLDRRDAGQESATSGITDVAKRALRDAIVDCASKYDGFTSDMVLGQLSFAVVEQIRVHPAAVGAAFTAAAKRNEIEMTGRAVRSQRPSARGRRLAVWRRRAV